MRRAFWIGLTFWLGCVGLGCVASESADRPAVPAHRDKAAATPGGAKLSTLKLASKAKPKEGEPAPEISETRALIVTDGELLRLAPSGRTKLLAKAPGMFQCGVDDHHRVIWLTSNRDVSVYDPKEGTVRSVVKGASWSQGELVWQVLFREGASPTVTAGNVGGLEHCLALAIEVGERPAVGALRVAEGDREIYCVDYDEADDGVDREPRLNAEQRVVQAGFDRAKLVDPQLLIALNERRNKHGKRTRRVLNVPAVPDVKVDQSGCEASPEDCGTATYVGGSRLWWIVTSNSRGDFFHETRQLYDSKSARFWDPAANKRGNVPLPTPDESAELSVSPDGTWGLLGDKIISLDEARTTGTFAGAPCGWE